VLRLEGFEELRKNTNTAPVRNGRDGVARKLFSLQPSK